MVFVQVPGNSYVKRTLVHVDSQLANAQKSEDTFTFTFDLPEELQNVISIELVQYNVPQGYGTMLAQGSDFLSYMYNPVPAYENIPPGPDAQLPLRVISASSGAAFDFTMIAGLDPYIFQNGAKTGFLLGTFAGNPVPERTQGLFGYYALQDIDGQLAYDPTRVISGTAPSPDLTTTYWIEEHRPNIGVDYTQYDRTLFAIREGGPFVFGDYGEVRLLNESLPLENNPALTLGFNPYVDAVPAAGENVLLSPYMSILRRYPYIDLFVDEAPEFSPLARIPLVKEATENFVVTKNQPRKTRMLTRPIPQLKQLRIRLRLEKNLKPPTTQELPCDLVFEIKSLSQVSTVPEWVDQIMKL